jgi:tRNA dimethylallyltransferase
VSAGASVTDAPATSRRPTVAIIGPTASGKSALALALARELPPGTVEIVAADAMQVYRGMDIGTAKATVAEQAEVPHHCIDLVDPSEEFTVSDFQAAADHACSTIVDRGHRAVLVGGTGLYVKAVVEQLVIPGRWPQLRRQYEGEATASGSESLHARLAALDPVAAAKIEPTNERRVVRALEVTVGSGRPFSSFGPGIDQYPPGDVVQLGLRWPRPALAARIEGRVEAMMRAGLLEEVRHLSRRPMSRTAAQALGYKELLAHLAGQATLQEAVDQIVIRTRQFAVRQDRWFRRDPRIRWIEIGDDLHDEALVATALPVVVEALAT